MAFSYKTKHTLPIQPSHHASWHFPKDAENLRPCKNPHVDVRGSFIHVFVAKTRKQPRRPLVGERINCGPPRQRDLTEMSCQARKSHGGGTLNAYYEVKEANLKRSQFVGFQLQDILEKAKLWRLLRISSCQGLGGGRDE